MAEKLFETMTSADFMEFLRDIPINRRTGAAWFLIGWFQMDLSDTDRARAANTLLEHSGVTMLPLHRETPAGGSSPL